MGRSLLAISLGGGAKGRFALLMSITRTVLLILSAILFAACASVFREQVTEVNPAIEHVELRIDAVAADLLTTGKAANIEEAREMARKLVKEEIRAQREAARENENTGNFYERNRNERAE